MSAAVFELSAASAPAYLRERGVIDREDQTHCWELGGGVSNSVVRAETPNGALILKQSLPQLRVRDLWLADRSRIFRERDALQAVAPHLPPGAVPEVLFSDERNFLYAMRPAGEPAVFWKKLLLEGECDSRHARRAGIALGLTIRCSWGSRRFEQDFGDQTAFEQLRLDPYYGTIARRNPDAAAEVEEWVEQTRRRRVSLVHGDWSPKNMMVTPRGMTFIDYECAHYGDPSFDSGFLVNHLVLKAFHRPELAERYLRLARVAMTWTLAVLPTAALPWFSAATARHLAFLMLARIDGKSPVEYLRDEAKRSLVRETAKRLIGKREESMERCLGCVAEAVTALRQ